MPRLSIVLTFYDETAFIDMAIGSVFSQPIDDVELILVNDNPQEFGPDYFQGLNLPDAVKVIHHPENKGLSAARNTGIAAATAPIIGFLDGDDYYVTGGLAQQLALAEESGADITHASCYLSKPGSPEIDVLRRDRLLFHTPNVGAGLKHFEETQFITSSWANLYRRDFLDLFNLRFDEDQPKFEDRLFVLQAVTAARLIVTLGEPARVWRQRGGSISVTQKDPYIHRLQVQLIEKCLTHVRTEVTQGRLPLRFEKRELFNTVSRVIWDMDIIAPIVAGEDPVYDEFADRIVALLGNDRFGSLIFDDPVLTHTSRVGMRTRKGFIGRSLFFQIHKALRAGNFVAVQGMMDRAMQVRAAKRPPPPVAVDADVIVHLGMHKTGSTFLQHHLIHHRDALLKAGILVPGNQFQGNEFDTIREGAFSGHSELIAGLRDPQKADTWENLRRQVIHNDAHTVMISCENMLFPINQDRGELLSKLLEQLGMFRSIRIVAYVRRPDTYVEALYKEIVANARRMGSRSIQEFMVDHADMLTNLPALFTPFETATGQAVTLLDFDGAAKGNTLWTQFCKTCDLPDDLETIALPRYPSVGRNGTQAARVVNTLIAEPNQRKWVLRDLFLALPLETDEMSILSPHERATLIDKFEKSSADFCTSRGYRPDFDLMRTTVPQKWIPETGLNAATLLVLQQARLRAEMPPQNSIAVVSAVPAERTEPVQTRQSGAEGRKSSKSSPLLTVRVRPRPWVLALLKWRPFKV